MSPGILTLLIVSLGTFLLALNAPQKEQATSSKPRTHALSKITVHSSEAKPYDRSVTPSLMEIQISETFSGDLEGESKVHALQVQRSDKSATMVSLQRFSGKLGGRRGTFVLLGSENVENGVIKATWFVVPGRARISFPGCAVKAVSRVVSERVPMELWITGSSKVVTIQKRTYDRKLSPRAAAPI